MTQQASPSIAERLIQALSAPFQGPSVAEQLRSHAGLQQQALAQGGVRGMMQDPRLAEASTDLAANFDFLSPIKAYHGSPHVFDKFDMSKVGTGEGAQSYGHGLYFAENPKVAADYRNKLADERGGALYHTELQVEPEDLLDWDVPLSKQPPKVQEALAKLGLNAPPEGKLSQYNDTYWNYHVGDRWQDAIYKDVDGTFGVDSLGDARFATLEEATRALQAEAASGDLGFYGSELYSRLAAKLAPPEQMDVPGFPQGWGNPQTGFEGQPLASQALREAGVPGIRYADQQSRFKAPYAVVNEIGEAVAEGDDLAYLQQMLQEPDIAASPVYKGARIVEQPRTRNFVLFADELAKILARE